MLCNGRATSLIRLFLRSIALVLALTLSGAAHRLADLVHAGDRCHHEESSDDDESECPPGCPSCHACAHAQTPYAPRATFVRAAPITIAPPLLVPDRGPPSQNDLPSLFRPPRAFALHG